MPTYEYRCPKGHVFEKSFPQMTNRRRLKCPTCGQLSERLISGSGLVFKGSGFYITDYKRAGEKKPTESETKPDAKPDAKPDTKPDAKSDAKSDAKAKPEAKPDKPKSPKKDK